ncbi:MAG: ABC transporter ATPase [Gammaproteobacteria bacterium]|nr:MAG: ABC transporter ATPase [Gammaproteobacteria bacterium]
MPRFRHLYLSSLLTLTLAAPVAWSAGNDVTFFRYHDANGVLVMGSTIPADIAKKNGYEVVDSMGRVIRKVPPAPTEEEIQARKLQKLQEQRERERAALQAQEDEKLLRLYAVPEDAIQARERRFQEIDTQISFKEGARHNLSIRRTNLEKKAADLEKSGREVPKDILDQLASLSNQIQRLDQEIAALKQDKQDVEQDFARKIERLRVLVEERRRARLKRKLEGSS